MSVKCARISAGGGKGKGFGGAALRSRQGSGGFREVCELGEIAAIGWIAAIALPALTHRFISMRQRQIEVVDFVLDDHFAPWDFANTFPAHRPEAPSSANNELLELIRVDYVAITFGNWFENQTEPIQVE